MNRDQLLETLEKSDAAFYQRNLHKGATVVISRRGARILGLFPCREGRSDNALWVHPKLGPILLGATRDWDGEGEGGMGGDRLWLSPEQRYFYGKPETFEDWAVAPDLDPGHFSEKSAGPSIELENRFPLKDQAAGLEYPEVVMNRSFRILEDPPATKTPEDAFSYGGVETIEEVRLPKNDEQPPLLCPWGLTQVPLAPGSSAGTVIIPTRQKASVLHYFGEIPSDRIRVNWDHVIFKIDSRHISKLAVQGKDLPLEGPVRIAYLRPVRPETLEAQSMPWTKEMEDKGDWQLVLRESEDVSRAPEDALDSARANPDGPKGVVQSYNNGPPNRVQFGEIELQYPPLRGEGEFWHYKAVSRLLAFHGKKEPLLALAHELLGLKHVDLFE